MNKSLKLLFIAVMAMLLSNNVAIANATDDAKSFFESAETKFGKCDYYSAIADYTKAIELDPKSSEAYLNRG